MQYDHITDACDMAIEALEERLEDDAIETYEERELLYEATKAVRELRQEAQKREYPTPTQQLFEAVVERAEK